MWANKLGLIVRLFASDCGQIVRLFVQPRNDCVQRKTNRKWGEEALKKKGKQNKKNIITIAK